jgi:hypothetical protein
MIPAMEDFSGKRGSISAVARPEKEYRSFSSTIGFRDYVVVF